VTVDAERDRGAEEWSVAGIYLAGEAPDYRSARGVESVRVAGWVAVRCLPAAGTRRYTLAEPQVERYDAP